MDLYDKLLATLTKTLERLTDMGRSILGMEPTQKPGATNSSSNVSAVIFPDGGLGCGHATHKEHCPARRCSSGSV
jgi:hypothetical protein